MMREIHFKALAGLLVLLLSVGTVFAVAIGSVDGAPATSGDVVLLVVYVLLALVFSFFCSVAEAVLLSITPSFIAGLAETSPRRAALIKKLKQENVDRSLAAILTLNTIAHTVGAIGSGSKATAVFGSAYFGIFSAIMTLMILFLSEIIPKTLGAVYWRKLAGVTALFVRGLIWVLYPLIILSEFLTKFITRGKQLHVFSREEFMAMAAVGEESGNMNEDETRIIHNLLRMEKLQADDIMTPRTVVVALDQEKTVSEGLEKIGDRPFSRIPIFEEDVDHISGFVLRNDLLLHQARGKGDTKLSGLRRDVRTVPSTMTLSMLLEFLLDHRAHLAVVADEFGGTKGLISLEDVVETLLGMEIVDEADQVVDMQAMARMKWKKRAKELGLDVEELE